MQRAVARRIASSALLLCLVAASAADAAEGDTPDETERWVPSAAFSFDVMAQRISGSVVSSEITGPPLPEGCETRPGVFTPGRLCNAPTASEQPLTPNTSDDDLTTAALVGLSLELMAPRFTDRLGRPRLFAHTDGSLVFAVQRKIAGTGDPGRLGFAPGVAGVPANISERTLGGQGSRIFSELQTPLFAAGSGLAFSFDLWGRRIRVKPSFEYLLQQVEFEAKAKRAVQTFGSLFFRPDGIEDYRLISFAASKTVVHHGIGGGLELEADTSRIGPFVLSVFLGGRVYHLLGDLDETLCDDTNSAAPSVSPDACRTGVGERVVWEIEPESLVWRGGVGLRFRFLPE